MSSDQLTMAATRPRTRGRDLGDALPDLAAFVRYLVMARPEQVVADDGHQSGRQGQPGQQRHDDG